MYYDGLCPVFKFLRGLRKLKTVFFFTISPELMGEFEPNLHSCITGRWKRTGKILVTLTAFLRSHFSRSQEVKNV